MAGTAEVSGPERLRLLARARGALTRLNRDGTIVARSDESHHQVFPVAIPPAEGRALRYWVEREEAAQTVEVGFGYGMATLAICLGLLTGRSPEVGHEAIDPFQESRFAGCGRQIVEDAGLAGLVTVHEEESQLLLPQFLRAGRTFDLAFVDGSHHYDRTFVDLFYLARLIRPGGVIFIDDFQLSPVAAAVSYFVTDRGWSAEETSPVDAEHQWTVMRLPAED